jgi:hypothetical protein
LPSRLKTTPCCHRHQIREPARSATSTSGGAASTLVPAHPQFNSSRAFQSLKYTIPIRQVKRGFKSVQRFARPLELIGLCVILLQAHRFFGFIGCFCFGTPPLTKLKHNNGSDLPIPLHNKGHDGH